MEENKKQIYSFLIIFFVFLFIKKLIDFTVEVKLPTYNNLSNVSYFWKLLVGIRDINSFIVLVVITYMLSKFKFNFFMYVVLSLLLLNNIIYFLIDRRLIYKIVNKSELDNNYVNLIDIYADKFDNLLIALFSIYVMIKLFYG
jgi:hypothetical protein